MEYRDYPEAPKAVRVVSILGIASSIILIILSLYVASNTNGMESTMILGILMFSVNVVLMVYLYRNSVVAAYIFLGLKVFDLIMSLINKNFFGLIIGLIIGIFILVNLDDMKRTQAWFNEHRDGKGHDAVEPISFLVNQEELKDKE